MPDNINTMAREVVDIYEKESNNGNAKRLQKLLSENEKAMDNLLKTLESGQAVDIIAERITPKKRTGRTLHSVAFGNGTVPCTQHKRYPLLLKPVPQRGY